MRTFRLLAIPLLLSACDGEGGPFPEGKWSGALVHGSTEVPFHLSAWRVDGEPWVAIRLGDGEVASGGPVPEEDGALVLDGAWLDAGGDYCGASSYEFEEARVRVEGDTLEGSAFGEVHRSELDAIEARPFEGRIRASAFEDPPRVVAWGDGPAYVPGAASIAVVDQPIRLPERATLVVGGQRLPAAVARDEDAPFASHIVVLPEALPPWGAEIEVEVEVEDAHGARIPLRWMEQSMPSPAGAPDPALLELDGYFLWGNTAPLHPDHVQMLARPGGLAVGNGAWTVAFEAEVPDTDTAALEIEAAALSTSVILIPGFELEVVGDGARLTQWMALEEPGDPPSAALHQVELSAFRGERVVVRLGEWFGSSCGDWGFAGTYAFTRLAIVP